MSVAVVFALSSLVSGVSFLLLDDCLNVELLSSGGKALGESLAAAAAAAVASEGFL